jgi:hypothetical protein
MHQLRIGREGDRLLLRGRVDDHLGKTVLWRFLGIAVLLLSAKRHTSGRTSSLGVGSVSGPNILPIIRAGGWRPVNVVSR